MMAIEPSPANRPVEFLDVMLAGALVLWTTMILLILAFVTIPKDNVQLFTMVATGGVIALLTMLAGNRWGSSKGSQAKDDVIGAIATKAADTPQP